MTYLAHVNGRPLIVTGQLGHLWRWLCVFEGVANPVVEEYDAYGAIHRRWAA